MGWFTNPFNLYQYLLCRASGRMSFIRQDNRQLYFKINSFLLCQIEMHLSSMFGFIIWEKQYINTQKKSPLGGDFVKNMIYVILLNHN